MDMRRFLPILLIAFAALFILPQLFKHGGSKTLSSKDRSLITRDAMLRIDKAEKAGFASNGRYTGSLADLVVGDKMLAGELTVPLIVDLDVGAGGESYPLRVSGAAPSVAPVPSRAQGIASNSRTRN